MGGSRKTAYAFWLIIGVLIANPAILDLLIEGPKAFVVDVKVDRLADFTAGVVSEQKSHIVSKILWPVIYCFCLLYTSPSPRDGLLSRMPSSA